MKLSGTEIRRCLESYGFSASAEVCAKIEKYTSLLIRWNQRISLTTISDPLEIIRLHFGESIFATSSVPIANGRLADVGTGGGFPGLPLKIARPGIDVTLIEANLKKCAFLSEVVRALELDDVEIVRGRMENVFSGFKEFDFITARAVGQVDEMLRLGKDALRPTGKIVFWLGEND